MKLKLILAAVALAGGLGYMNNTYNTYVEEVLESADEEVNDYLDDDFSFFGYWTGKDAKKAAREVVTDQLLDQYNRIKETGELY